MQTSDHDLIAEPGTARLGLGVLLDMPWHGRGFRQGASEVDPLPNELDRFFDRYRDLFGYSLLAFQPRDYSHLRADSYIAAYDRFYTAAGTPTRAFHQTTLNLAASEPYDRSKIIEFTNELSQRYSFAWVVEDLAVWSIRGKSLPYPLPPMLTDESVEHCVRNVEEVVRRLSVPLHIEFPGFTEGASFALGTRNAIDFFAEVVERSGAWATIDVGHVLGYLTSTGRPLSDIERLPLNRCRELHLAGCSLDGGRFQDTHSGVLLDEQIDMTAELIARAPSLVGITYEDPRYRQDGSLAPPAETNFYRLVELVAAWRQGGDG
jgi:uncharacterized protein (UPF0276 family)